MIVVIDTSVWISALQFGRRSSIPFQAIERACKKDKIVTSPELYAEAHRILTETFFWSAARAREELDYFHAGSSSVELTHTTHVCRDPMDDMFLECAAIARADVLVAGDKDLLTLGSYAGTRILSPRAYLELPS